MGVLSVPRTPPIKKHRWLLRINKCALIHQVFFEVIHLDRLSIFGMRIIVCE